MGNGYSWVGDPKEKLFLGRLVFPWCWVVLEMLLCVPWVRVSHWWISGVPSLGCALHTWVVPPRLLLSPVPAERAAPGPGGGRARSLRRVQPALLIQHRVSARP